MSFLLDVLLLVVLLAVVALYARRSIFAALTGVIAVSVATVAAFFLIGLSAPPLAAYVTTPLIERSAANELADMYSAPHEASGRETVRELPLGVLLTEEPEAYRQLLAKYSVSPETVRAAYEASPSSETVLIALTEKRTTALSRSAAFVLVAAALTAVLRLIAHRVEQNFPPVPRYRGMRRLIPGALGIAAGLVVLWVTVAVLCWVVPVVQGQSLSLNTDTLAAADWFSLLRRWDPFLQ